LFRRGTFATGATKSFTRRGKACPVSPCGCPEHLDRTVRTGFLNEIKCHADRDNRCDDHKACYVVGRCGQRACDRHDDDRWLPNRARNCSQSGERLTIGAWWVRISPAGSEFPCSQGPLGSSLVARVTGLRLLPDFCRAKFALCQVPGDVATRLIKGLTRTRGGHLLASLRAVCGSATEASTLFRRPACRSLHNGANHFRSNARYRLG
jgi:hypothetical protein